jgi:colanic acid biosynthesis glycosyl transferase WcaI
MPLPETSVPASAKREVLVLSINYTPEPTGFAPHVAAFCEHLVQAGYGVTVFTGFPFAPRWARWPEYRGRFLAVEEIAGVRVVRHTHFIPRSPRRMLERLLMEGSFCFASLLSMLRFRPKADVVIYVGAQPSLAMFARWVAWFRRMPYGVMINDLATGAASNVGIVKSALLQRCLHAFEYAAYRRAAGAVVLCQSFKDVLVTEGYPADRIAIVRSPVNMDQVRPLEPDMEFRRRNHIEPGAFVVLFAGSMGLKQGLENVIAAARLLRDEAPLLRWILVGDGETRAEVERLIREAGVVQCVRLLPFQPVDQISAMLSVGNLLLLNQLSAVKDTVIPSKLLTYMAAGRPVVAAVNASSQGAELLREAGGGRVVPPEHPAALAMAVREMSADAGALERMGRANRTYALEYFDERKVMQSLERFVRALTSGSERMTGGCI